MSTPLPSFPSSTCRQQHLALTDQASVYSAYKNSNKLLWQWVTLPAKHT